MPTGTSHVNHVDIGESNIRVHVDVGASSIPGPRRYRGVDAPVVAFVVDVAAS
jgi:hypothetical protein